MVIPPLISMDLHLIGGRAPLAPTRFDDDRSGLVRVSIGHFPTPDRHIIKITTNTHPAYPTRTEPPILFASSHLRTFASSGAL